MFVAPAASLCTIATGSPPESVSSHQGLDLIVSTATACVPIGVDSLKASGR